LDAARQDPTLSLIVSLFELADLEAIFDCPGPISAALPTNSKDGLWCVVALTSYLTIFFHLSQWPQQVP
jgi:hypothetical protein